LKNVNLDFKIGNQMKLWGYLFLYFIAFLSVSAWWDFGKPKKESPAPTAPKSSEQVTVPELEQEPKASEEKAKQEESASASPSPAAKALPEGVEQIQTELKQIIDRTNVLRAQAQVDRAETAKILERAQIHERILRTITLPPAQPVPIRQVINVDDVARREKIRLIADQTKKTQDRLRILERTGAVKSSQSKTAQDSS
jgi:hypothetical protein